MNEVCNDVALAGILKAFKNVLMLIQIIGPILCIVGLVVLFIRLMHNPDEKNGYKKIINCVLALVLTFSVPILVNAVVKIAGDGTELKACWENSGDVTSEDTEYVDLDDDKEKTPIVTNPNDFERAS